MNIIVIRTWCACNHRFSCVCAKTREVGDLFSLKSGPIKSSCMRFLSHSIVFLRQTSRSLEKSRKTLLLLQLMYFIKYFLSVLEYKLLLFPNKTLDTTCIGQSIVYEIRIHKMKKKSFLKLNGYCKKKHCVC